MDYARLWEWKDIQESNVTFPRHATLLAALSQRGEPRELYAFVECGEGLTVKHNAEVLVVTAQHR